VHRLIEKPSGIIALLLGMLILSGSNLAKAQHNDEQHDSVMLILGSANPQTLQHRIEVGVSLYNSGVDFDRVVVSGGCGAHDSAICEASRMDSLLAQHDIPREKIFKEEKSSSTKQNLCYSQKLMHNGEPVIGKTDNLYVVSDHWHAIPVAGCFNKNKEVNKAVFHIEGDIEPKGPVDYTDIFEDCSTSNFCKSMLWAFVDAAYYNHSENKIYYFVDDTFYRKTPGAGIDEEYPKALTQYPGWPEGWSEHVDAAYYNPAKEKVMLFNGDEVVSYDSEDSTGNKQPRPITDVFAPWPEGWHQGYIDAAYYQEEQRKLFLFKNDEYRMVSDWNVPAAQPENIQKTYTENWPFRWGTGDIDAAYFHPEESNSVLFRGTQFLKRSSVGAIDSKYPKAISLPWPKEIWGEQL